MGEGRHNALGSARSSVWQKAMGMVGNGDEGMKFDAGLFVISD